MEQEILRARLSDLISISEKSCAPKFMGFLTEEEQDFLSPFLKGYSFRYFGGYKNAGRCFLGVFPDFSVPEDKAFPITAVTFTFRGCDTLSHRDFLGALMALGIKRETVGDILVERGRAVVFISRDVSRFVMDQIRRIGRVGVTLGEGYSSPLPECGEKITIRDTVASLRLDCVVASLAKCSRAVAEKLINDRLVGINSVVCEKCTRTVCEGDKISIRGYGRFTVVSGDTQTKKGRTVLITEKYK